ncbi:MAG: UvrB/UvrC motif-containing protein [Spirochaetes bacterium]|nr:UvrB/UvrC motif-containing protein [Spirochaetota bacterium]
MLCNFCQSKEAILHIQAQIEEKEQIIHLCLECAILKGFNLEASELQGFFSKVIENILNHISEPDEIIEVNSYKCSYCKTTIEQISKNNQVGCALCFEEFGEFIDILLFQIHHSLDYKGSLPNSLKKIKNLYFKMDELNIQLQKYIENEEFKKAAHTRDQIQTIKTLIEKENNEY